MNTENRTHSRRVVVRSAAWTVPAIAVAVAAPLAAASAGVAARIEVLSDATQSLSDGVALVFLVLDAEGNGVPGRVRVSIAPGSGATFVDSGTTSTEGTADETGFVAFGIYAEEPATVDIAVMGENLSTSTSITVVA